MNDKDKLDFKLRTFSIMEARFKQELKLDEIAKIFSISRERVRQIISKNTGDGKTGFYPTTKEIVYCKYCQKKFLVSPYNKRVFCSEKCSSVFREKNRKCNTCGSKNVYPGKTFCRNCSTLRKKKWLEKDGNMKRVYETVKKQNAKFPEKFKARQILNEALKKGKIIKPKKCLYCEETYIHGHHPDYTKPLEVIWLCPFHHKKEHKKVGIIHLFTTV